MKKIYMFLTVIISVGLFICFYIKLNDNKVEELLTSKKEFKIIGKEDEIVTAINDNMLYQFKCNKNSCSVGSNVEIEYMGNLDEMENIQDISIINCIELESKEDNLQIPDDWQDDGIFSQYYKLAYEKLKSLSLEEKVGQILLVRYNEENIKNDINRYHFGGFIFYEKDFQNKSEEEVKNMIENVQDISKIPLLTAVDEEGGKIVRISSNPKLVKEKFKSSSELYTSGGLDLISKDTKEKSKILNNLGINLNLAPVVDITDNPSDYIYERTLKQNTLITSQYAKTVIEASKKTGVSYTLKHFPGYGSNTDTHQGISIDNKSLEDIKEFDLPPFEKGIEANAEAIMFSHNTVNAIDSSKPISLSLNAHNLLKQEMGFTGITITDDISMDALNSINNSAVKALLAGNEIIITTNYKDSFEEIKKALSNGIISEDLIDHVTFKVLSWKYYKGIITDEK